MSFFDDASLVMIPSGYKTSKVYSVKPTDGSGDLAFTRSNDTATRVGPDGLIEKVRTNVLTYSQTFSDASWLIGTGQTKTQGQTDPNGGTTAVLISNVSEANGYMSKALTLTANVPNTFSIYIKGSSSGSVSLRLDDSTAGPQFDINYTTSWQRFSVTRTVNQASCFLTVGGYSTWAIGENIQFAFAQVETGDVATPYIATTTAAVSVGPVANVPRLDYLGSTCPRLLLEPQRTNLALNSESFDNATWTKSNATITANTTVSPDGTQSADTAVITAGGYIYAEFFPYAAVTGQSATLSVFAKNASGELVFFGGATTAGTDVYKIENYGNGWYRHSRVRTFTATAATTLQYIISSVGTSILWGAQVEGSNSAYLTSYIPTLGASVTRGADAASKTGISSLIGSTAGTVFFEGVYNTVNTTNTRFVSLKGAGTTYQNLMIFQDNQNGTLNVQFVDASVTATVSITWTHGLTNGQSFKVAIAYANNDVIVYQNGLSKGTDTSYTPLTFTDFYLQYTDTLGETETKQALLFTTRLTNAQLAELTTI